MSSTDMPLEMERTSTMPMRSCQAREVEYNNADSEKKGEDGSTGGIETK
jgi:hypothetical protein